MVSINKDIGRSIILLQSIVVLFNQLLLQVTKVYVDQLLLQSIVVSINQSNVVSSDQLWFWFF